VIGVGLLVDLLAEGMRRGCRAEPSTVECLTVHLAERDGVTVAAAVLVSTDVHVSDEWQVAA